MPWRFRGARRASARRAVRVAPCHTDGSGAPAPRHPSSSPCSRSPRALPNPAPTPERDPERDVDADADADRDAAPPAPTPTAQAADARPTAARSSPTTCSPSSASIAAQRSRLRPVGRAGRRQPDLHLGAIPRADTTHLTTTITVISRGPALDLLNELADDEGFTCYTPDGGTRCEKTWQNEQYPVTDGRTLFWRDDILIDTTYSNLAPSGYTVGDRRERLRLA